VPISLSLSPSLFLSLMGIPAGSARRQTRSQTRSHDEELRHDEELQQAALALLHGADAPIGLVELAAALGCDLDRLQRATSPLFVVGAIGIAARLCGECDNLHYGVVLK
jgi:hypothetical protein